MTKALLIEDDRKLAALLVEFLGQHGVEATNAVDSTQALQHLGSSRFDILLLDLMLPGGLDGFNVIQRLRAEEATKNLPILVISAMDDPESRARAKDLGASEFYGKPFRPLELLEHLKQFARGE